MPHAGAKVMKIGPQKHQHGKFHRRMRNIGLEARESGFRGEAHVEQEQKPDEPQEKQGTARAMENRDQTRDREIERTEVIPKRTLFFRRQIRHVKQSFRTLGLIWDLDGSQDYSRLRI